MTHYTTTPAVRSVAKAFALQCKKWGVHCTEDEMAFCACYRIPKGDADKMSGYANAMIEGKGVSLVVSDSGREAAFVFVEDQYNSPTAAHSRKQSAFPKSLGKSRTFGGVDFPPRKRKSIKEYIETDVETMSTVPSPVIETLNALRAGEIAAILQYELFAVTASSMSMAGLQDLFSEHEEQERGHARRLAQRVHEIGGEPVAAMEDIVAMAPYKVTSAQSAVEMVGVLLGQEEIAIRDYRAAIRGIGDSDPTTRRLLEDILAEEEEHAADARSMLQQAGAANGF